MTNAYIPQRTPDAGDKVAVEINGMLIHVPKNTVNVYLVQAHVNPVKPEEVSGAILTTDLLFGWNWLIEALADGGWGRWSRSTWRSRPAPGRQAISAGSTGRRSTRTSSGTRRWTAEP